MENLKISFTYDSLDYQLSVPCDNNIPYNLAAAFAEVIKKSNANDTIVIGELIDEFNYQEES